METDQLIAEVARETGVRLNKADPVLATAALYSATFDRALAKLDRQMKVQIDRVTVASDQAVLDAKKEAESLLSDAGAWIENRIKAAGEAAAAAVLANLRRETEKAEQAKRVTIRVAWAIAMFGLLIISGAAGVIFAGLR